VRGGASRQIASQSLDAFVAAKHGDEGCGIGAAMVAARFRLDAIGSCRRTTRVF
jgi:hypothetical protein